MGATIEQIIAVLNSDTGNLAYNLVLSFSLAGALFFAVAAVQRNNSPAVRRTIVGLSLLLVLRLALFVASGLVWQGVLDGVIWLPLLGRAITLLSLVLITWLWAFDEPSPAGDTAAFLLGLLVLTGAILGGVWWSGQTFSGNFNHTTTDRLVQMAAIAILALGILALLLRRPEGWVFGLVMESLLFAGHVIYLVTPADIYDYPTVIRLFQMAAYPFLLFLAQRLYPSGSAEVIPRESGTQHQVEPRQAVDSKTYNVERVLSALQKLTTESEPSRACHRACASIVELMDDEICVLVEPSGW